MVATFGQSKIDLTQRRREVQEFCWLRTSASSFSVPLRLCVSNPRFRSECPKLYVHANPRCLLIAACVKFTTMGYQLGILGAGNMAEAIVRGVLDSKRLKPDQIIVSDVSPARRGLFQDQLHVKA